MSNPKFALSRMTTRYRRNRPPQSLMYSVLSFVVTFILCRAGAHASAAGVRGGKPSIGGTRLHHAFWGILALVGVGYGQLIAMAKQAAGCRLRNLLAVIYGSAAALTLDEFTLWLHLGEKYRSGNRYWDREGRKNIWAVWAFGLLLAITAAIGLLPANPERRDQGSS